MSNAAQLTLVLLSNTNVQLGEAIGHVGLELNIAKTIDRHPKLVGLAVLHSVAFTLVDHELNGGRLLALLFTLEGIADKSDQITSLVEIDLDFAIVNRVNKLGATVLLGEHKEAGIVRLCRVRRLDLFDGDVDLEELGVRRRVQFTCIFS